MANKKDYSNPHVDRINFNKPHVDRINFNRRLDEAKAVQPPLDDPPPYEKYPHDVPPPYEKRLHNTLCNDQVDCEMKVAYFKGVTQAYNFVVKNLPTTSDYVFIKKDRQKFRYFWWVRFKRLLDWFGRLSVVEWKINNSIPIEKDQEKMFISEPKKRVLLRKFSIFISKYTTLPTLSKLNIKMKKA